MITLQGFVTFWRRRNFLINMEYLAPQIRNMNNRFHSEAKLPWSYDHMTTL